MMETHLINMGWRQEPPWGDNILAETWRMKKGYEKNMAESSGRMTSMAGDHKVGGSLADLTNGGARCVKQMNTGAVGWDALRVATRWVTWVLQSLEFPPAGGILCKCHEGTQKDLALWIFHSCWEDKASKEKKENLFFIHSTFFFGECLNLWSCFSFGDFFTLLFSSDLSKTSTQIGEAFHPCIPWNTGTSALFSS